MFGLGVQGAHMKVEEQNDGMQCQQFNTEIQHSPCADKTCTPGPQLSPLPSSFPVLPPTEIPAYWAKFIQVHMTRNKQGGEVTDLHVYASLWEMLLSKIKCNAAVSKIWWG